jgi:hypothetical protein
VTNIQIIPPVNDASEASVVELPRNHIIRLPLIDDLPEASAVFRRCIVYTEGGVGEADFVAVCRKNEDDDYEWAATGAGETLESTTSSFQISVTNSATNSSAEATDTYFTGLASTDLTDWTEVRVSFRVATAGTTSKALLMYTTDNFGSDDDLTSRANAISLASTGVKTTDWGAIPAGARGPITIGLVSFDGNGSESPAVVSVVAQFRR